mmetsp:Transcript_26493/g.55677  ORF Transcript_26493/g.55677 Transcript_26493/m.55677 type:complete len:224 (+) Transcript_26493:938-1609(+)
MPHTPPRAQCVHPQRACDRVRLVAASIRHPRATSPLPVKLAAPLSPPRPRHRPRPIRARAHAPQDAEPMATLRVLLARQLTSPAPFRRRLARPFSRCRRLAYLATAPRYLRLAARALPSRVCLRQRYTHRLLQGDSRSTRGGCAARAVRPKCAFRQRGPRIKRALSGLLSAPSPSLWCCNAACSHAWHRRRFSSSARPRRRWPQPVVISSLSYLSRNHARRHA